MATHTHAVIRLDSAIQTVFHEITDGYDVLRRLCYAFLNDKFTPDDLRVALSFGEHGLVLG
jgi:hypothetical protein